MLSQIHKNTYKENFVTCGTNGNTTTIDWWTSLGGDDD